MAEGLLGLIRDHPRVGGGNATVSTEASSLEGPSPRGRGKRNDPYGVNNTQGTIPAWAGETV